MGGFRLDSPDGCFIAITDRRARHLIAHLAVAGRGVPRIELAAAVCPDGDETDQRTVLRQSLYLARKAAGSPELILVEGEDLRLNPELVDVDLWRFRAAVDQGDAVSLAEAVRLYRGPLLAGVAVPSVAAEGWLAPHRTGAEELALGALLALASAEEAAGRDEESLALLRRAIEVDPLREDAQRHAMRAYARLGRRTAALRQYQDCREALERDLGVAPEPETVALAERIARGGSEDGGAAAGATPAGTEGAGVAPPCVRLAATAAADDPDADGPLRHLVDDLSAALCEYRWFDVADHARTGDTPEPPAGSLYLLQLVARRSDGVERLTARLSGVACGRLLLANRFDPPETPTVLLPRDEEVGRLAAWVDRAVRTAEIARLCGPGARPRSAYEHMIHACRHLRVFRPDDNARVQALLREAHRLDPRHARVCGLLLWAVWLDVVFHWRDGLDALAEVAGLAEDAMALDPSEPLLRIHLAGARVVLDRDFETGLAIMRETTARNPHLAVGWGWLGWLEVHAGDPRAGIEHLSTALRLSPESAFNFMWEAAIGIGHFARGEAAASLSWLRKARHNRPNYPIARAYIAANLAEAGREAEARAEMVALRELSPRLSAAYIRRLSPYGSDADRERYIAALVRAGLPEA